MARFVVLLCLAVAAVAVHAQEPTTTPPQLPFDPCPVCMTAAATLDTQLKTLENVTQTIAVTLSQACDAAPAGKAACLLFVRQYGGLFAYGMSVAKYSLEGFCPGVFFCPPTEKQLFTQNGVFQTICDACKTTMGTLLATMTSEQAVEQVQALIKQICSAPLIEEDDCIALYGQALQTALQTTTALLDPTTVCTLLGPCAFAAPTPTETPAAAAPVSEEDAVHSMMKDVYMKAMQDAELAERMIVA